jgi:hypothetical protein
MMFYRLFSDKAGDERFYPILVSVRGGSPELGLNRIQLQRDQGKLFFVG